MKHTKGKLRVVRKVFKPPYLHIGTTKIAVISRTGNLTEEEELNIADEFAKRWNCHKDLLEACKNLMDIKYLIDCSDSYRSQLGKLEKAIKKIKQAIAKAGA